MVSIIMPVNNSAIYLSECIDSIINQSYKDWEIIAVNNGSKDNSLEILKKFALKDRRIRVYHIEQADLLKALRIGYNKSKGNYIHRMDSDDKMPKYKLSIMVKELDNYGDGFVITGGTKSFSDEKKIGNGFKRYDDWICKVSKNNLHTSEIYRECVIPSNCWLISRKDFDLTGGFNSNVFPEDYDLCFRFYERKIQIIGIDKILHFWRDHSNRISRNWECYLDNRFFNLKTNYFSKIDRDYSRPLVIWGAGKNGKDLIKLFKKNEDEINWVCDNRKKIGKDIYGIKVQDFSIIKGLKSPQIIIAVASPKDQKKIEQFLFSRKKISEIDYWFFS